MKITPLSDIIHKRINRRSFIKGLGATGLGTISLLTFAKSGVSYAAMNAASEVPHRITTGIDLADGYKYQTLLRWGDALFDNSETFNPLDQNAEKQKRQFGYNCDYIAFMPLPYGSNSSTKGLLCVNHEHTTTELMFPGLTVKQRFLGVSKQQAEVEMAAHGQTIVEIEKTGNEWQVNKSSQYNRRLNGVDTLFEISGPARGSDRLKTSEDSEGRVVKGMLGNCSGGITPYGTVLTCEENVDNYFCGDFKATKEADKLKRFGFKWFYYSWGRHFDRFNVDKEPNEVNRFGWVVEFDPYDPAATPIKRTALGRFKHEAANTATSADGRVVVYMGDDSKFEYLYRFVSRDKINVSDRKANQELLDEGVLSVAKFDDKGKMKWIPLIYGQNGLNEKNGFFSQADVVIDARKAGDILGATAMDRPEDVEMNPKTGRVYVVLTKNSDRNTDNLNVVNPKAKNMAGHIIELIPPPAGEKVDHGADEFAWEFFLFGGPGKNPKDNNWLACPDNITFDNDGRIWISTDGSEEQYGFCDGVYYADTEGKNRGKPRNFLNCPTGAEATGPCFTPDNSTFFLSVQHPAAGSTYDKPSTRWPDFNKDMPPRPSVIAVTKAS